MTHIVPLQTMASILDYDATVAAAVVGTSAMIAGVAYKYFGTTKPEKKIPVEEKVTMQKRGPDRYTRWVPGFAFSSPVT